MKEITIREFIELPEDVYNSNKDFVQYQLDEIYSNKKISICWSPTGFIGTEVNGKIFKNKTTYDILLNTKVRVK